jgi:shikimate 5-dehydrogenase
MTPSAEAADDTRVEAVAKELVAFRSVLRGQGKLVLGGRVVLLGGDEDALVVARALLAIGVQELTIAADDPAVRAAAADLLGNRSSRDVTVANGAELLAQWQSAHGVVDARPAALAEELPLDRALLAPGAWLVCCRRADVGAPLRVTEG